MANLPDDARSYEDNAPVTADPWGADRSAEADWRALAEQAVRNGGRIRQLEVALAAEKQRRHQAERFALNTGYATDELAIRKFLDDLAAVGLPSTLYSNFSPEFREYITGRLVFWADTANEMLGRLHNLNPKAVARRDEEYAEQDAENAEHGSLLIKGAEGSGPGPIDGFTEMMRDLMGDEDEDDEGEQ